MRARASSTGRAGGRRSAGCRAGGVLISSVKLEPAELPRGVRPWMLGTSLGVGTSSPEDDPAERDASILAYRQVVIGLAAEDAKCRVE